MKQLFFRFLFIATVSIFASCATTKNNVRCTVDTKSNDVFRVTATGDQNANPKAVNLICARAAADHALAAGARSFVVVSQALTHNDTVPELSAYKVSGFGEHLDLVDKGIPVNIKPNRDITYPEFMLLEAGTLGLYGIVECFDGSAMTKALTGTYTGVSSMLIKTYTPPAMPPPNAQSYEPQDVLNTIRRIAPNLPL